MDAKLDMQRTIFYQALCLGIGASSCSGSLEFFCGTGWAAESTDARRPKSDLGTDFCQRCGGPKTLFTSRVFEGMGGY
jgi:hypothetical protein